jgi:hypothetical protein
MTIAHQHGMHCSNFHLSSYQLLLIPSLDLIFIFIPLSRHFNTDLGVIHYTILDSMSSAYGLISVCTLVQRAAALLLLINMAATSIERKDGPAASPTVDDDDNGEGDASSSTGPLTYPLGKIGRTIIAMLRHGMTTINEPKSSSIGKPSKVEQLAAKERKKQADILGGQRSEVARKYFASYLETHVTLHVFVLTPACSIHILPSTLDTVILPELNTLLGDLITTPITMMILPTKLTPIRLNAQLYRFTSLEQFNGLSNYARELARLERVRDGLIQRQLALQMIARGQRLMAADLEANEYNPAIILELGCSFLQPPLAVATVTAATPPTSSSSTSSISSSTSSGTTSNRLSIMGWTVATHHYIVAEQAHHVNKRWVAGCPDKFNFGRSEKLPLTDVTTRGIADLARIDALVGHSLHHDVRYLRTLGVYHDDKPKVMIDTQRLNDALSSPCPNGSLEKQLAYHNITPVTNLHNAGNDSHYTALLLLAQLAAEPASQPPSITDTPAPPVLPLPADDPIVIKVLQEAAVAVATAVKSG